MNAKTLAPLGLALVLGTVAAYVATDMISKPAPQAPQQPKVNRTSVVVAARDIAPGTALGPEDVAVKDVEESVVPSSAIRSADRAAKRVTASPMPKGAFLIEEFLAPEGTGQGVQAILPKGKRAITIAVDEFTGMGVFILPGCKVDVVSTVQAGQGGGEAKAVTVVQDVSVLAVGPRLHPNEKPANPGEVARSVTLVVTPEQAQTLELVASTARPRLVMRASGDGEPVENAGIGLSDLRSGAKHGTQETAVTVVGPRTNDPFATPMPTTLPANAKEEPQYHAVQVIRGGVVTEVQLPIKPKLAAGPATRPAQQPMPVTGGLSNTSDLLESGK
jgi:pilus assembly protein CpaB